MENKFIKINRLSVDSKLVTFVKDELLKDLSLKENEFWKGFDKVVHELAPKNRKLIETRETMQKEIDLWHKKNKDKNFKFFIY